MNILIVEDDRQVRGMLFDMINALGRHEVSVLCNGHNAVSLLADPKHGFNLVFLDLNLPRLDGKSVIEALSGLVKVNIVVMSGDPEQYGQLPKTIRVLTKPFSLKDIEKVMVEAEKGLLEGKASASAPRGRAMSQKEMDRLNNIGFTVEF
ncbi:MAG: response regulator [Verrucomicrobiae bacterium]|nr:response regulator [Verrucomicrobiae bacterium]